MTEKKNAPEIKEAEIVTVEKETAVVEITTYEKQRNSVEGMIAQAIEKGLPVETMERILAMRKELKADWAKEQFDRAMAAFQAECPVIEKKKEVKNDSGKVLYSYAPLESILTTTKKDTGEKVSELISKHGLSYSFKTTNTATEVDAKCIVKHIDGYSEESNMLTALSNKTNIMSAPQQIAATLTFNKRYAFLNAFGITTGGEDDESQLPKDTVQQVSAPALGTIRQMIKDAKKTEGEMAQKFNVATLEEISAHDLKVLEKSLLAKLGPDYIPTIIQ